MLDTVTVEIRDSSSPFSLIESQTVVAGLGNPTDVQFATPANGTPYYIRVKHRNSIATWSGSTQSFNSDYLNYTFISASTQALGSNMVNVGGKWSFYSGDVTQDGLVDVSDTGLIDNDALIFASGYLATDLDCNEIVDLTDASYADNNAFNFVAEVAP